MAKTFDLQLQHRANARWQEKEGARVENWKGEFLHLWALIKLWRLRHRQRKQLATLPEFMLKDIGISRTEAQKEAGKAFWKS